MQAILAPFRELADYDKTIKCLRENRGPVAFTGCVDSQKLHVAYCLSQEAQVRVIVTYNDVRAKEIYEEYQFYDKNVMLYPAKDYIFFQADLHGNQLTRERVKVLQRLAGKEPFTIVTTFAALLAPQVMWREEDILHLERNGYLEPEQVARQLVALGYEKCHQVQTPGQFAMRGDIVDIFPLTEENPVRIELWGDEIESLRSFDVLSQRSLEQLQEMVVYPAAEFLLTQEQKEGGILRIRKEMTERVEDLRSKFLTQEAYHLKTQVEEFLENLTELSGKVNLDSYIHYFYGKCPSFVDLLAERKQDSVLYFIDEPERAYAQGKAVESEFAESMKMRLEKGYLLPGQMEILFRPDEILHSLERQRVVTLAMLEYKDTIFDTVLRRDLATNNVTSYKNNFSSLVADVKSYLRRGYRVLLLSGSRARAERLVDDLRDREVLAVYSDNPEREAIPGEVLTMYGRINKGFEYSLLKFVVISENDILGTRNQKKQKHSNLRKYGGQRITSFDDLKIGDYVVHEQYGLGVYKGIQQLEEERVVKDYFRIEYLNGDYLLVPASDLDNIQKYANADTAKPPKINRLGSSEWAKTKSKVRTAVDEVAKDLVELYASRQNARGFQFSKDTVWQTEFEEQFPYEETRDQLDAIADTKADMESERIMDRLICGDVGYGKTEIAIRAAFKAVQDGKQVAYLVPTTILAQQHYNTFVQRFKDYPVHIELLSRFKTTKEVNAILEGLSKKTVDIVIGTHKLLSDKVKFADLGLLVIDEEQRFGVTHKEKIKKLKENVDVLTLSATPIPRTLHMSLVGIRDMSVLQKPPEDRLPIQTYVLEYNEEMVREAIARELARGGQVYYVYNHVNNIADVAANLAKLMPEASVAYAHGQMKEHELENIMMDFIQGEIDVLVSTTIIETGLDISNVNTIIIRDSENMGLSQLYQLRGRVGRSNRTAYAFLMYKRDRILSEVAQKRLGAIKEFTELGSGFRIAMRDLEIRGAGNLLGKRQHGHMAAVGYDLYCKMLNQAVMKCKGLPVSQDFATVIDLNVDAYIPETYIVNEEQKLDIYKRIADMETEKDREEMLDELLDRFGQIPEIVDNLLRIARIRVRAHELGITDVKGIPGRLTCILRPDVKLDIQKMQALLKTYQGSLTLETTGKPRLIFTFEATEIPEEDGRLALAASEQLLDELEKIGN